VTHLKEELDIRTEELREHRRLLARLIERVPELEAAESRAARRALKRLLSPRPHLPCARAGHHGR
jgi:hypothetical protein